MILIKENEIWLVNLLQTLESNKNTLETADFVPSLLEIDAKLVNLLLVITFAYTYCF